MHLPSKTIIIRLSALACALIPSGSLESFAWADTGVVELSEESLYPETDQEASGSGSESTTHTNESTISSDVAFEAPRSSVDRPWMINTPAGPTAYVLDQHQLQLGLESIQLTRLLYQGGLFAEVRYGLTDSITLGVGYSPFGTRTILLNPKWNFYNDGNTSYSFGPAVEYIPSQSENYTYDSYKSASIAPVGFEFSISHIYNDRNKLHFSLTAATYSGSSTSESVYSWGDLNNNSQPSYSSSNYSNRRYAARISSAYELRISRKSGFTFSLSSDYFDTSSDRTSSGDGTIYFGSTGTGKETTLNLQVGVGFQYFLGGFGAYVGLEGGPQYRSYNYGYGSYSYLRAFEVASGSITVDYRL